MTLADTVVGKHVTVKRVNGSGKIKERLEEMGLIKGTDVIIERFAPFGDPMQITLRGYSLAIRKSEGKMIEII